MRKNAVRQFYLEQQVADYISNAKEDYAIVVSLIADVYPYVPISTLEIDARDNIIYTSGLMNARGVTNGYYLGNRQSVAKIMSTVNLYDMLDKPALPSNKRPYYEEIISETLKINELERRTTDMIFCKLRNHHLRLHQPYDKVSFKACHGLKNFGLFSNSFLSLSL